MKLYEDLFLLEHLDYLIRSKATGTPDELAARLKVCRRKTMRLIAQMRIMGLPVVYDKQKNTYFYSEYVKINFEVVVGKDSLLCIKGGGENNFDFFLKMPNFGTLNGELCGDFRLFPI